jgi:inositol hexakisphosphate/diphosphoinositol-pentakisphosphate kinase
LDDSLEEEGLIPDKGMHRIFETKELDYLTHIVMRMYENTAVSWISFTSHFLFLRECVKCS